MPGQGVHALPQPPQQTAHADMAVQCHDGTVPVLSGTDQNECFGLIIQFPDTPVLCQFSKQRFRVPLQWLVQGKECNEMAVVHIVVSAKMENHAHSPRFNRSEISRSESINFTIFWAFLEDLTQDFVRFFLCFPVETNVRKLTRKDKRDAEFVEKGAKE